MDVLVNNAGITKDGAFHKMTPDQWNSVINTNLGSLFNMTRQVIESTRARKFGRVISISSINGQKGQFGQVNYSAAKAGDIGFTKALALENAKGGITVNVICPGYINTEMVQAVPKEVLEKSILRRSRSIASASPRKLSRGGVPCRRRGWLHHGFDANREWRAVHGVSRPTLSNWITSDGSCRFQKRLLRRR